MVDTSVMKNFIKGDKAKSANKPGTNATMGRWVR